MEDDNITLKSGDRVDLNRASAIHALLRQALPLRPDVIAHVRAQVEGRTEGPPPWHPLTWILWDDRGDLRPDARAVFVSAFRDAPGGPIFDDPFAPAGVDEATRLVRHEEDGRRRLPGIVERVLGQGPGRDR